MNPRVAVFHGGPGLSASYFDCITKEYASRVTLEYHNPLGCDPSCGMDGGAPSLKDTLADMSIWFRSLRSDGVRLVLAHSWGAYILYSLFNDAEDLASDCRVSLWNPVPLDKEIYDVAVGRLVSRVSSEASAEMDKLGSSLAGGRRMMELAWPFYSPGAARPRDLTFDYFPDVFSSVSSGLRDFNYWSLLGSRSKSTEIVFGSNDYIGATDFSRARDSGVSMRVVPGGHFPFVENPRVLAESVSWLLS